MSPSKPAPLSGFPELLPAERFVELHVLDQLRATFELHGFAPVETRAAEPLDQLLRKGEIDKEVYVLQRLQAGPAEPSAAELGLHFDLTVPFARYVLENAGKLDFPFRRYQIQKVWRGERPQEGRFREFTQADIDVVARDVLPFHHDIEVARVMAEALSRLPVPTLTLQINNRKLIQGFYSGIGAGDVGGVMRVIDKIDKLSPEAIGTLLADEVGLDARQVALCLALAEIRTTDTSFVGRVRALGVSDPLLDEGLAELAAVMEGCAGITGDRVQVQADLRIARGLDYYTGTVFETRMAGFESLGSICSGGPLRLPRHRRSHDLPRRGDLAGRVPAAHAVVRPRPAHRYPLGALGGAGGTARRAVPTGVRRARAAPAGPRHPHRGRGRAAEVRQADPLRRTTRHPVRLVPGVGRRRRHRRHAPRGQGHPQRCAGSGRPR